MYQKNRPMKGVKCLIQEKVMVTLKAGAVLYLAEVDSHYDQLTPLVHVVPGRFLYLRSDNDDPLPGPQSPLALAQKQSSEEVVWLDL